MLGDIVGTPGRQAVAQQIPVIRQRWRPDLIIANAENAANGSGITPSLYAKLRSAGVDGITLGDHVYKKSQIVPTLERETTIIRPANISAQAAGRTWMRLDPAGSEADGQSLDRAGQAPVFVTTVLGRIFSNTPADDPFVAVDQVLRELPVMDPIAIVEVHAEATSEKRALGWYLNGRVAAVIGSHTHVATADAQILDGGTAYITDIGMCGPYRSILGRAIEPVLKHMTTGMHAAFDVAEGDVRACGVFVEIDESSRRATAIERIELPADMNAPPFVVDER
jgi:metallophosphoesterase (TIGR00282 family)